ncbi:MAG: acetylxylan esterase [Verrucomicrobiota bacterium]
MSTFADFSQLDFAAHSRPPVVESFRHRLDFDPTYGHRFADLLAVRPPENAPTDFEAFWRGLHARALAEPTEIERKPDAWASESHRLYRLRYTSLGGVRIGAWLLVPVDEASVERGVVVGHGYGGRDGPSLIPGLEERAAMLFPCARGLPALSGGAVPGIEAFAHHVLVGIEDKFTYVHGGCAADHVCAVTVLLELFPQVAGRVAYWGSSFGGGMGALFAPWEDRLNRVALGQPSFGHHPYRVTVPCTGSGAYVKERYERDPGIMDATLRYFDAASAATHLRVPALVAPSLFDPGVPPPGQFAVFNAIPGPKTLHLSRFGHFAHRDNAEEERLRGESLRDFLHDL